MATKNKLEQLFEEGTGKKPVSSQEEQTQKSDVEMDQGTKAESSQFKDPQEEIAYLRKQLQEKEQEAQENGVEVNREQVAENVVDEYKEASTEEVVHPEKQLSEEDAEGLALNLAPEEHDPVVEDLYGTMLEKGVKNTINVVARMNNPHIDDDFHRFLVQYIQSEHTVPGLVNKSELHKALHMRLFEVTLPQPDEEEGGRSLTELVSLMEQFLAGMQSVSSGLHNLERNYYSLEMGLATGFDEVVFYVGVPSTKVDLFQKQIFGLYDEAKVEEVIDDYNVFNPEGVSMGSYARPLYKDILQLKTYDNIDHDPLNVLLNVFTKLDRDTEGAAVQIVIRPAGDQYIKKFGTLLDRLKDGEDLDDVFSEGKRWGKSVWNVTKEFVFGGESDQEEEQQKEKKENSDAIESVTEKLKSTIVETNIRLVASAQDQERATDILHDIESAFQQFTDTSGNGIKFERPGPQKQRNLLHEFSYRFFNNKENFRLNLKEISSLYHFPIASESAPQLKQSKSTTAPVPVGSPEEGVLLGFNKHQGKQKDVYMGREDRVRHFYVIGQTGTGKTNILKNMITQDIRNGDGCCFIDPHGDDVQDIAARVPKERLDDVIYFDPGYTPRPIAFNMLEYDPNYPEQKSFVVDEMFGIFDKLFDMASTGGPMFEQYFRNATALVIEDPESGSTLLDVSRVLADEEFRNYKLSKSNNVVVNQFWEEIASQTSGEAGLQNIVPYITSKFDVFLSNEIMRPIVGQQNSAFDFREVMDNRKILLVNLSKGRLGDKNANLLGLIIVGKILMSSLSRVDVPKSQRPDFYLYADEFQNVTTDSISQILSEARKYRLSLNMAHQYIAQLDEGIKDSVFGNVGSMGVFRISSEDADYIQPRFKPKFDAQDIMSLENFNCYLSMLSGGEPIQPFNVETYPPEDGDENIAEKIKELSYLKFGRPREEVESEIAEKYRKMKNAEEDFEL